MGHEIDISLTDLVADVRAATPSAAAELALADRREVLRQLDDLAGRLGSGLSGRTRLAAERLERTSDRMQGSVASLLHRHQRQLERLGAQLDALSPLRVLQRGYAVPVTREGRVLGPHEKISREEALRIATYNNAFATWEEKVKGSIEPGKLADFLVLSGDFMTIPEDEILKLHPMATYVGGRKVYAAPEANGAF